MLIVVLWRGEDRQYYLPDWGSDVATGADASDLGLTAWLTAASMAWQQLTGQAAPAKSAIMPSLDDLTLQDSTEPTLLLSRPDNLAGFWPIVQDVLVIPRPTLSSPNDDHHSSSTLVSADEMCSLVLVHVDWPGETNPGMSGQPAAGLNRYDVVRATAGIEHHHRLSAAEMIDQLVRAGGCDLHLHTTASDGSDSPAELFARVRANQLRCFAVTDHDVMNSLQAINALLAAVCAESTQDFCPIFIPGVEISVSEGRELHVLGYFPFGGYLELENFLEQQRQARHNRNIAMVEQLRSLGYDLTLDELADKGQGVVGRMQAAQLLTERGYTQSTREAFEHILGFGKPGYVERPRPSLAEAIWQIRRCGGVPILAHPAIYHWCSEKPIVSDRLLHHLSDAKAKGLLGVEAYHGEASDAACQEISAAARFLGLLRTCGSDDHGRNKTTTSIYSRQSNFFTEREILVAGALIRSQSPVPGHLVVSAPTGCSIDPVPDDGQTRYLLARRSTAGHGFGQWELPGGKIEPGEQPVTALQREIREELGVDAEIGPLVSLLTHAYDGFRIILACFDVTLLGQSLTLAAHDRLEWKTASEALQLDLLAADVALFETLPDAINRPI